MRLGVASSFNCDPLRRWLKFWLKEVGIHAQLSFAGYAQLGQELSRPDAFDGAAACAALLNLADWQRGQAFDASRFDADLQLLCDGLEAALPQLSGRLLVLLCPARPISGGAERAAAFSSATARLKEMAVREPRLSVVSVAELMAWYPVQSPFDRTADELGHVPYSEPMWCALGAACARVLRPSFAPPLKAIVVDCDYTLWQVRSPDLARPRPIWPGHCGAGPRCGGSMPSARWGPTAWSSSRATASCRRVISPDLP